MKTQTLSGLGAIILLVSANGAVQAAEIRGRVTALAGTSVTVTVEGELAPNVDDPLTIYFTLPGSGDEVVVGTGKVTAVAGNIVTATVADSPGKPQKDQLVRITSTNPKPRTESKAVTPSPTITDAPTPAPSVATNASRPGKVWDFSDGKTKPSRSHKVELVDGKIWRLKGHHLRFIQPGESWLEATFELPKSYQSDPAHPVALRIQHLASSPDGKKAGHSPVRITLNNREIFNQSPPQKDWMQTEIELGDKLQPGTNTLRWDLGKAATTHYWLKSFAISPTKP